MSPAPLVECEGTKDRVKKETKQQEVAVRKRWKGRGNGDPFRPVLQCGAGTAAVMVASLLLVENRGKRFKMVGPTEASVGATCK